MRTQFFIYILIIVITIMGFQMYDMQKHGTGKIIKIHSVDTVITIKHDTIKAFIRAPGKIDTIKTGIRSGDIYAHFDTLISKKDSVLCIDVAMQVDYFMEPMNEFRIQTDFKYNVKVIRINDSTLIEKLKEPPFWKSWWAGAIGGIAFSYGTIYLSSKL